MKNIIVLASFFMLNAAQAEVFKCTDAGGKTVYQETPCQAGATEKVDIKAFDPNKIAEAQAKLAEQLKQAEEREKAAAEAAQKERDIQAKEAIAAEARDRTDAINRNTQIIENINQTPPPVYYVPPMTPPSTNPPPQ